VGKADLVLPSLENARLVDILEALT